MNYIFGILISLTLVVCVMSFPIPTLIGVAIALAWWLLKGRYHEAR